MVESRQQAFSKRNQHGRVPVFARRGPVDKTIANSGGNRRRRRLSCNYSLQDLRLETIRQFELYLGLRKARRRFARLLALQELGFTDQQFKYAPHS